MAGQSHLVRPMAGGVAAGGIDAAGGERTELSDDECNPDWVAYMLSRLETEHDAI